jgi:hypothetical protein
MAKAGYGGSERMTRLLAIVTLTFAAGASAEDILYHGAPLDEQHRVQIAQEFNSAKIGIVERTRVIGQDPIRPLGSMNTVGVTQRRTPKPDYLCEVRVQILQPSAPNYIQNPGQRYRITIIGLKLAPDYASVVEVFAAQARDTVFYEIEKLRELATGVEKEALGVAAPLTVNAFKAANLLPAEIFESVRRSRGGRFRITENTLQVRRISPTELFAPSLTIERPRLGATIREEEEEALPRGTAGLPFKRGYNPSARTIGLPRTPTAPGIPSARDEEMNDVRERRRVPVQPLQDSPR